MAVPIDRVRLDQKPAVVVVARAPSREPCMICGPLSHRTLGNCVVVGASAHIPGSEPLAFLAHLSPEDARMMARRIDKAADEVEAMGGGEPAEAILAQLGAGSEEAATSFPMMQAISASVQRAEEFLVAPPLGIGAISVGASFVEGTGPVLHVGLISPEQENLVATLPPIHANAFAELWTQFAQRLHAGEFDKPQRMDS